jgi:hypothetical protein
MMILARAFTVIGLLFLYLGIRQLLFTHSFSVEQQSEGYLSFPFIWSSLAAIVVTFALSGVRPGSKNMLLGYLREVLKRQ